MTETEWDDYEEDGPLDLEDQLERALDRAFPRPKGNTMSTADPRLKHCLSCQAPIIPVTKATSPPARTPTSTGSANEQR